jgi:hypothetical protein
MLAVVQTMAVPPAFDVQKSFAVSVPIDADPPPPPMLIHWLELQNCMVA